MKLLNTKIGFSLLQAMIAGSIITGLSVVSLKMFQTQKKTVVHSAQQYEEEQIVSTIRGFLSSEDTCSSTFGAASGTVRNLQSFDANSGTFNIRVDEGATTRNVYGRGSSIGRHGLTISRYRMLDTLNPYLQKYFGATVANVATQSIKFTVLLITFDRRSGTDDHSFGTQQIEYGIPLVATTLTTPASSQWLIQTCRAASGNNSVWSRSSSSLMNIYYADGKVGIGAEPTNAGATAALVQVNGDTYINGNIQVDGNTIFQNATINNQMIIPNGVPPLPANGMMWWQ